jgi:hypothetical protein
VLALVGTVVVGLPTDAALVVCPIAVTALSFVVVRLEPARRSASG